MSQKPNQRKGKSKDGEYDPRAKGNPGHVSTSSYIESEEEAYEEDVINKRGTTHRSRENERTTTQPVEREMPNREHQYINRGLMITQLVGNDDNTIWRKMREHVGILLLVLFLLLLIAFGLLYYVYTTSSESNRQLTLRIEELEKKVLIDKDIEKLEETVKSLTSRTVDLESKSKKLKEDADILHPKVKDMDKTLKELEPMAEEIDGKVTVIKPQVVHMETIVSEMKPRVDNLETTVFDLVPTVEGLVEPVGAMRPKLQKLENQVSILEPRVKQIDEKVNEQLEPKVEKVEHTFSEIEPKVNSLQETVFSLKPTVKQLDETVSSLKPVVPDLDNTVKTLTPKVKTLKDSVPNLEQRVEKLDKKVTISETLTEDVTNLKTTTRDMQNHLSNLGEYSWKNLPESKNRIDSLEMSSKSTNTLMYLQLFATFCLVCWTLYSHSQTPTVHVRQGSSQRSQTSTIESATESYRPVSVLDRIHPSTLTNQICVVSFYLETKALHMRLVESACSGSELNKVHRVSSLVSVHEKIPDLPRSKIYLVFVDFNERDIILEHPEREIGDLRMTTVQGARKMGGDVFVVYVKDKGSQNLDHDHLYNERLRSIVTHPELSVLNEKQRVLTTYDEFTVFQRTHLAKCFIRTLQK